MGTLSYIAGKLFSGGKEVALTEDNGGIENGNTGTIYWTKYPDGTLMYYGKGTISGGAYDPFIVTYPIPFIDVDNIAPIAIVSQDIELTNYTVSCVNSTTIEGKFATQDPNSGGTTVSVSFFYQIIGRWK